MPRRTIPQLLAAEAHDPRWLRESLQAAIDLEFSTIPLYLSAMWSIINPVQEEAYYLIMSVVMEEMLHMSLACNMLKGIGGSPKITAPTFPATGLPGGVMPHLRVYLAGLSYSPHQGDGPAPLDMFMEIEHPTQPVRQAGESPETFAADLYSTIGDFYTAIGQAFTDLHPAISKTGQLHATLGVPDPDDWGKHPPPPKRLPERLEQLGDVKAVHTAIETIIDQGEGTRSSPDSPLGAPGALAHYYRFGEIKFRKKFIEVTPGHWAWQGDPLHAPACYPVVAVPSRGYPGVPEVEKFGNEYFTLLTDLRKAWNGGGQTSLDDAVNDMNALGAAAKTIVVKPIPGSNPPAHYGPDFIPRPPTGGPSQG